MTEHRDINCTHHHKLHNEMAIVFAPSKYNWLNPFQENHTIVRQARVPWKFTGKYIFFRESGERFREQCQVSKYAWKIGGDTTMPGVRTSSSTLVLIQYTITVAHNKNHRVLSPFCQFCVEFTEGMETMLTRHDGLNDIDIEFSSKDTSFTIQCRFHCCRYRHKCSCDMTKLKFNQNWLTKSLNISGALNTNGSISVTGMSLANDCG